jgi:hypothetical protein
MSLICDIEPHARIDYFKYLTVPERTQHIIGVEIQKLDYWEQRGHNKLKDSIQIWKDYGHLINDTTQTEITRKLLSDLLESNYSRKIALIRFNDYDEYNKIREENKTKRMKDVKQKIKNKLNKLIPELKINIIVKQKKEFLKNIESEQLPHDLENLIFSYFF